jgi:hypothetical protein
MKPGSPNAELRTFNENDILGDFDRDDKGNIILLGTKDKKKNLVNEKGYLVDTQGNIISTSKELMFSKDKLHANGQIPGPYWLERFNFNVH